MVLTVACALAQAEPTARITVRNPSGQARTDVISLRLRDIPVDLPAEGGLEVRDAADRPLRAQWDDLDLSGGPTPEDALAVEVKTGPYEALALIVAPGSASKSTARALSPDQPLSAGPFKLRLGPGGWLSELRVGDSPSLVAGAWHSLFSGGFIPPATWDQRGLTATMVQCQGPLRQAIYAVYDFDERPFHADALARWAGDLKPGCRAEMLLSLLPDHVTLTVTTLPRETAFAVEESRVVIALPLPGGEPSVLSRWGTASGEGAVADLAAARGGAWGARPDLRAGPTASFSGGEWALDVVCDPTTLGAASVEDSRETTGDTSDVLRCVYCMDAGSTTLALVPRRAKDKATALVQRLSAPLLVEGVRPQPPPELVASAANLQLAGDRLREAGRGEAFLTPAWIQVQAGQNLLAMAQRCALQRRPSQARRLAAEIDRRASLAELFLDHPEAPELKAPTPARLGSFVVGAGVRSAARSVPGAVDRMLAHLKACGITAVSDADALAWRQVEPTEGRWDLSAAAQFVDAVERQGLGAVLVADPRRSPPAWALTDGALAADRTEGYLEEVLPGLAGRTSILAWVVAADAIAPDFTRDRLAAFREWLATRYPSVDALNSAWGTTLKAIDEAPAPRPLRLAPLPLGMELTAEVPVAPTTVPGPAAIRDAGLFSCAETIAGCKQTVTSARQLDPDRPALVCTSDGMMQNSPLRVGDPWSWASLQPVLTCHRFFYSPDMGRAGGGFGDHRLAWPLAVALTRSASDAPVWCGEFNLGWWSRPFRSATRPEVRLMTWMAAGEGLRGVFAHQHPGGQWAIASFDDTPQPLLEELGVLSAEMQSVGPLLAQSSPWPAEVALHYSATATQLRFSGQPATDLRDSQGPRARLRVLWQALSVAEHYPVKFVDDAGLQGDLSGYRALLLPEDDVVDDALAAKLTAYVGGGGLLVAIGPCGAYDPDGRRYPVPPAPGLRALLGARLKAVREGEVRAAGIPLTKPKIPVTCWEPEAADVRVLARETGSGDVAAFSRDLGAGQVLVVGFAPGIADTADGAGRRWLVERLARRGIFPPLLDSLPPGDLARLYARIFSYGGRDFALLANLSGQDQQVSVTFADAVKLGERPFDLLTGRLALRRGPHTLQFLLPADDVAWLSL
jgi:hypothetical protein